MPVVLQISENAVKYRYGRLLPLARAAVAAAEGAAVPVALHLDHVQNDSLLRAGPGRRVQFGDVRRLPAAVHGEPRGDPGPPPTGRTPRGSGSRRNWARSAARTAHRRSTPTRPAPAPTPPRHAPSSPTPVWTALAVAVGSSHAMTTRTAALDHDLLKELSGALDVPLVLHGSLRSPGRRTRRGGRGRHLQGQRRHRAQHRHDRRDQGVPRRPPRSGRLARLPHGGKGSHGADGGDDHPGGRPDHSLTVTGLLPDSPSAPRTSGRSPPGGCCRTGAAV